MKRKKDSRLNDDSETIRAGEEVSRVMQSQASRRDHALKQDSAKRCQAVHNTGNRYKARDEGEAEIQHL